MDRCHDGAAGYCRAAPLVCVMSESDLVQDPHPDYVLPETTLIALIGGADLLSTAYLLTTEQAQEANPLMAAVLHAYGPWGFAFAKFLALAVPLSVAEFARRYRPGFVRSALRIAIAAYIVAYALAFIRYNLR
jgi:hypothetical protein